MSDEQKSFRTFLIQAVHIYLCMTSTGKGFGDRNRRQRKIV